MDTENIVQRCVGHFSISSRGPVLHCLVKWTSVALPVAVVFWACACRIGVRLAFGFRQSHWSNMSRDLPYWPPISWLSHVTMTRHYTESKISFLQSVFQTSIDDPVAIDEQIGSSSIYIAVPSIFSFSDRIWGCYFPSMKRIFQSNGAPHQHMYSLTLRSTWLSFISPYFCNDFIVIVWNGDI